MSNIINTIEQLSDLCKLAPATREQIKNAEIKLGKSFAEEYKTYLETYGVISAKGVELTGISNVEYLDVVKVTQYLKEFNNVPEDFYAVEDTGMDGIVVWQNKKGEIYLTSPGHNPEKISNSLAEYLQDKM